MRRYWTCRRCKYRNERTASRTCINCGSVSKPKRKVPAQAVVLRDNDFQHFAELNERIHGLDENTCAICGKPGRSDIRLQREHAHRKEDSYGRGLAHALCNKMLGEVERGRDAEEWLESALGFVRRSRLWHEEKAA